MNVTHTHTPLSLSDECWPPKSSITVSLQGSVKDEAIKTNCSNAKWNTLPPNRNFEIGNRFNKVTSYLPELYELQMLNKETYARLIVRGM